VQNAAEHGLAERGGEITVGAERAVEDGEETLTVTITDNGAGLPEGFAPGKSGLGTQIVTSLVQDLRGRIEWSPAEGGGTRVTFKARLRTLARSGR
jgi:two-component sensor histidine kinase